MEELNTLIEEIELIGRKQIDSIEIYNRLREIRVALIKQFVLTDVVASLPSKEEIEIEAEKQANYIQAITNQPIYDIDKFEGFINGVNWYAEKMKK